MRKTQIRPQNIFKKLLAWVFRYFHRISTLARWVGLQPRKASAMDSRRSRGWARLQSRLSWSTGHLTAWMTSSTEPPSRFSMPKHSPLSSRVVASIPSKPQENPCYRIWIASQDAPYATVTGSRRVILHWYKSPTAVSKRHHETYKPDKNGKRRHWASNYPNRPLR